MVKGGSRSRFTENKTVLSHFTKLKQRHSENHGSRRIKHLFLVSRKVVLQNHALRLLWRSRFTRKKLAISDFTGKKGPITSHENTLYHSLSLLLTCIQKTNAMATALSLGAKNRNIARHDYFLDMFLVNGKESSKK